MVVLVRGECVSVCAVCVLTKGTCILFWHHADVAAEDGSLPRWAQHSLARLQTPCCLMQCWHNSSRWDTLASCCSLGAARFKHACLAAISIEWYRLPLQEDMRNAALIVSHAGAGSILERCDVFVVVNDALMDNHQQELAEELHSRRHLLHYAERLGRDVDPIERKGK